MLVNGYLLVESYQLIVISYRKKLSVNRESKKLDVIVLTINPITQ
jgi:hypothetical protein